MKPYINEIRTYVYFRNFCFFEIMQHNARAELFKHLPGFTGVPCGVPELDRFFPIIANIFLLQQVKYPLYFVKIIECDLSGELYKQAAFFMSKSSGIC